MIVKVELEPTTLWRLVNVAESRGFTTVGELFAAIGSEILLPATVEVPHPLYRPHPTKDTVVKRYDRETLLAAIRDGVEAGDSDRVIAQNFGCSETTIATHRNAMRMAPGRKVLA